MELRRDTLDGVQLAGVLDRGELVALYAQPDDERPWMGDVYGAQVTRYAPAQRAYFLDMGHGVEGFMPASDKSQFLPGQMVTVRIERPATDGKHMRCSLALDSADAPGLIQRGGDVVVQAQQDFPSTVLQSGGLQDYDSVIIGLLDPVVYVQEGLTLVIEQVTALTAVDVNNADPGLTPLEVNRLAGKVFARQMRLRNLNGQIVVDFLRMRDPRHREILGAAFAQAVAFDPRPVELLGFTRLGLYELTRTKRGLPLKTVFDSVLLR